MTSERQITANRENARYSTGPKTTEGKQTVRLNGVRHGLLSRDVILPGEDESAFEDLRNAIHAELAPLGPVEAFLADRVVNAMWRLQRLERVETALAHWRTFGLKVDDLGYKLRSFEKTTAALPPVSFGDVETIITDEALHATATEELTSARHERDRDEVLLGRAFNVDATQGDSFSKLARYETTLERSFFKTLHELQRIQAARRGHAVPLPQAVDLDVSVSPHE